MNQRKHNKIKRLVITTGALLLLAGAPIVQANPLGQYLNSMTGTITAQAAELPYSANWETQADGSWKYKLLSGGYAVGWIQDEVDHNWYYMNASQVMLSGLVKSDGGRVYLLSQDHDGHFGRMLENGQTYHGITIQADTSETYRGALSQTTLAQLRSLGLYVENAPDVSGSGHTTNGQTTPQPSTQKSTSGEYDGMPVTTMEQKWSDYNGDGYLTGDEYDDYMTMKDLEQHNSHKGNIS